MASQDVLFSPFEEGDHTLGLESGSYDYFYMNNSNKFSPREKIPKFECFNHKERKIISNIGKPRFRETL